MNWPRLGAVFLVSAAAFNAASCTSISQEQLLANERTRVEQERKGYFDRESGAQQRKADERAAQEQLKARR